MASPLVLGASRPGDEVVVQALRTWRGEVLPDVAEYAVVRDLPDPTLGSPSTVRRVGHAAHAATTRSRARRRLLRNQPFDVAYLHLLTYRTDWIDLTALRHRPPLVSHVHDVRPHDSRLPARLDRSLLRRTYRSAGTLVVYHDALRDELIGDFGVEGSRVHVLPLPLPDARPVTDRTDRPGDGHLLVFGSLRENKGLDVLCDALERCGDQLQREVVIAGDGPEPLKAMLTRRLGGRDDVRLELGHVENARKHELFAGASWVVLPYRTFHSQSGVLADAYGHRVPLVVTDVGAIGPTVRADRTGVVVPPADPDALAEALLAAVRGTAVIAREHLDEAARRHDPAAVGAALRDVFDLVTRA